MPAILFEHARLNKILSELSLEINKTANKLEAATAKAQKKAIRTATDTIGIDLAAFDRESTEALIGFGGMDTKYPLASMYRRIGVPLARKVESALVYGVVTGANNHSIAKEVRSIMNTTAAHALTIARTETNNAYREASRIAISESKAHTGYMWIAALDLRTCPICWRYHGKIFEKKQKFVSHPNCRCSLIAIEKDEQPDIEKLYEEGGQVYKLAEFIEGQQLNQLTGSAFDKAKKELQNDFAIDALLSNRDVIGLNADNVLVDKAGKVWRIDNGSALRFRAQGGSKEFDNHLSDLWTMRDSSVNAQAAKVFGDVKIYDLAKRMEQISSSDHYASVLTMVPDDLKPALSSRFEQMRDLAKYGREFQANDWADQNYIDEVLKHVVGLRKAGMTERLPNALTYKVGDEGESWLSVVNLYDENGHKFDSLRRRAKYGKMIPDLFEEYMRVNGGNPAVIAEWQGAQAGSSWNYEAQAFKYFIEQRLSPDARRLYWQDGANAARKHYTRSVGTFGEQVYRTSHAQKKALIMELLNKTELPHRDPVSRTLKLVRTERGDVVRKYGLTMADDVPKDIERGASESYSLVSEYRLNGNKRTVQDIPFTDIHGLYILNRANYSADTGAFAGNGENEVTALWRFGRVKTRRVTRTRLLEYGFKSSYGDE